jgi:hypothetical protein
VGKKILALVAERVSGEALRAAEDGVDAVAGSGLARRRRLRLRLDRLVGRLRALRIRLGRGRRHRLGLLRRAWSGHFGEFQSHVRLPPARVPASTYPIDRRPQQ